MMNTEEPQRERASASGSTADVEHPTQDSATQVNDADEEVPVNWRKKDLSPGSSPGQEEAPTADVAALEQQLREEQAKAEDYLSRWQRSQADLANLRRRNQQEREEYIKRANEEIVRDLLSVLDSFDRALVSIPPELRDVPWLDGIHLVDRQLRMALLRHGVTPIEAKGQLFDPTQHEAVLHKTTSEHPDATVTEELQKGYRLKDRVLRPTLVEVASNPDAELLGPAAQSTHEEK